LSNLPPQDAHILFRDDLARRETLFDRPEELLTAESLDELETVFGKMEAARAAGKWLAGYFSYEAGALFEPKLAASLLDGRRFPLAVFGVFGTPTFRKTTPSADLSSWHLQEPEAAWSFGDYEKRFNRVHQHLREGDCYQANLTFPVTANWQGDPAAIFDALAVRQPVRHSAFVNFSDTKILSRSPELFFKTDREGWIESLPMKGTARRGKTAASDKAQKRFLQSDPKNQSENRMIVDLLRNDISRISEVGTLSVPKLFKIETYETLHQMVSLVRAKLLPGLTVRDIFAALFPCGSITGAPKLSAMQILQNLEKKPRDIYCGSIGWIAPDGRMQFNVAIRTLTLYPDNEAVFNVGGGVVFDSTAEEEYAECLLKARFVVGDAKISSL
jgi:para-aminobenzoate synthetase component I